jgi:hypothetical protein
MNNPIYSVGGELGGDPAIDQITILILALVVAIFFVGCRWWSRRLSANRSHRPKL